MQADQKKISPLESQNLVIENPNTTSIQQKVIQQIHDPPTNNMEDCKKVSLEFEDVHIWAKTQTKKKKNFKN